MGQTNTMTKIFLIFTIIATILSCSKKDSTAPNTPVTPPAPAAIADFDITVTGQSPNALVTLVNKSANATSYIWTYSIGADTTGVTLASPQIIKVDKAGSFSVTLDAINSVGTKTITKQVNIAGYSALISYPNLKFGDRGLSTLPYCFSTKLGRFFQLNEITNSTGPDIDIVFWKNSCCGAQTIESPNNTIIGPVSIPGARSTTLMMQVGQNIINFAQFNAQANDSLLKAINIYHFTAFLQSNSAGIGYPQFVYFINADNKRGVICLKYHANDYTHVLGDIKVQKY